MIVWILFSSKLQYIKQKNLRFEVYIQSNTVSMIILIKHILT